MARKHLRFKPLVVILLSTITIATVFFFKAQLSLSNYSPKDRASLLRHVRGLINSGRGKAASQGQACRVPVLDVNSTDILKLLGKVPKVICNARRDWVEVVGSTAKISNWVKNKYGDVECAFTEIVRESDYEQHQGMTTRTHTEHSLESSDIARVDCIAENGRKWNKVILGIRYDQDIFDRSGWFKVPKDALKLNILMFGFDSLSHNMWKRKLPKTYKYAVKDLKGIALNGYNIVGDGTPQALIPILTGRTELELPDTRKRMGKEAQYVNVYPFIWNDFQQNGYVTAWGEDMIQVGTFTYRLKGFKVQYPRKSNMNDFGENVLPGCRNSAKLYFNNFSIELPWKAKMMWKVDEIDLRINNNQIQSSTNQWQLLPNDYEELGFEICSEQPVDHYMRTFYVEAAPSFDSEKPYCYGSMSRFQIMLNYVKNMYEVYKNRPKFIFGFHSEYSHDNNNWVGNADEDLYELLREFHMKDYLNNTLLILMSDHGSRFADIRNTQQGKQEERLPGFIFVFPPWFEKKYPEAMSNFKINADRLSTPFDIYETLHNVLHFKGAGSGSVASRGISLFKEIPASRTCQDASIEPHWCSCLDWEEIPVTAPVVLGAVEYLISFINSYTSENRDLCSELSLNEVLWSARLIPNEYVLKFKKNSDYDGFVGDMSDSTKITTETYEIKVSLNPGNMLFEASIRYLTREKKYSVSLNDISRTNKYQHMTHCIEDSDMLHQLRKYCYCR